MTLTSSELNYLIWRYLQESGHELAAFALQKQLRCHEYEKERAKIVDLFQPGTLVSLVQKGILYTYLESESPDGVSLVQALVKEKEMMKVQQFALKAQADAVPEFRTRLLAPALSFLLALAAQWHPLLDVLIYGTPEALATICAVQASSVAESVTLHHLPAAGGVATVLWAPQGSMVLTASALGEIRAWSTDGRLKNVVQSALQHPALLHLLLWSPHGHVLSVDVRNNVCLWDGNMQLVAEISGDHNIVLELCWLLGLKFALATAKHGIRIYGVSLEGVAPVGSLSGHDHQITSLQFNPVLKLLASALDVDYVVRVWNSLLLHDALELNAALEKDPEMRYHTSPIIGLHWLTRPGDVEGNELLSVLMEGVVNVWDAFTGDAYASTNIFQTGQSYKFDEAVDVATENLLVFASAVAPNGRLLAIGDDAGNVLVWSVELQKKRTSKMLCCLGMYVFCKPPDARDVGICDLQWDARSLKIAVCYKNAQSAVLPWL